MPIHPHHLLLIYTSLLIITPVISLENLLKEDSLNQVLLWVKCNPLCVTLTSKGEPGADKEMVSRVGAGAGRVVG